MNGSPRIEVERKDLVAIVRLRGPARILETEPLRNCLDELLGQNVRRIFVDLEEMDYVGALAVAGVVAGYAKTHRESRILMLTPSCIRRTAEDEGVEGLQNMLQMLG